MGLIKLLSVNQTFTDVKSTHSPYHVTEQKWLPRFGMADISELTISEKDNMKTEFKLETDPSTQPDSTADTTKIEIVQKPVKGRWLSSHYPQKANRPLRQAELCLETVKVMRNDLKDSDIDIVPVRNRHAGRAGRSAVVTQDLFHPVSSPAPEHPTASAFAVADKKGGTRSDGSDLFKTNPSAKPAPVAAAETGSAVGVAPKRNGYLGLNILTRWFGLGRGRAY